MIAIETAEPRHHLQRDLPGLGADAAGAAADRGARQGARHARSSRRREELLREKQPMLEFTTPEKIGALAVFLCGDAAVDDHRRRAVDRRRLGGTVASALTHSEGTEGE